MAGRLGAFLFGGIFAAFGIGFFILMVWPSLSLAIKTQKWQPAQATLQSVKLETHRGEDNDTYKVSGSYFYSWNGVEYTGSRLLLMDMSDNIGSFHQDLYRELDLARTNNQPVTVWVDPSNPSESILNRDIRWGLLSFVLVFVIVFSGIGLTVIFFALKPGHRGTASAGASAELPGSAQPWLENKRWQSNVIYSSIRGQVFVSWFFATICGAVSIQIFNILPKELEKENYAVLIALLFPLAGVALGWKAALDTLRWRRFGRTPLIMDPFPGSIGGDIGGHFDINLPYNPGLSCHITVNCVYSYMSGSGKNRSRHEKVIWQDNGIGEVRNGDGNGSDKTRVYFRFAVPAGLPQSDVRRGSSYHLWRVHASCELPGVDFSHSFEIPVFPTERQSSNQVALSREHDNLKEAAQAELENFIQIRHNRNGMELFIPMGKRIGPCVVSSLVGIVFLGAGVGVLVAGGPRILGGIFVFIGSLCVIGGIYGLGKALHTQLRPDGIYLFKYFLGAIIQKQFIARESIRGLTVKEYMSSNNGRGKTAYYEIKAIANDDKKITLAYRLKGSREAEMLLESIKMLSGYP